MTLHTLVHLGDGPTIPLWVRLGILLVRGVILLPARGVVSRTIRLPIRARRLHITDNGTIQQDDEEHFRYASLALLLDYILRMFPAASRPLVQPSSKRFHIFEAASIVDESSQRSSFSPGLHTCEPPAIRPRRCLNLGFWRAVRYPRFCPLSRGPRRCLTRLTKGRLSSLTPRSMTS